MIRTLVLAFALLATAAHAGPRYVSMGSSYAAGLGIAPYRDGAPARCARSTRNYASQLAAKRGLTLVDVGCSGARTSAILQPWGELPAQIDAVTADTALVTVTIGGNDIGLVGGLYGGSCRQRGEANCAPQSAPSEADYAALKTAMTGMVTAIRERAPKTRIVLVEYPTILPSQGACVAAPLTDADADAARTKAARLLAVTRQAAAAGGATVVTTSEFSRGHDACAAEQWMNGYPAPGAAPYHPNLAAMTAIAQALDAALPR
jgi:lysophospholipase L1-like esterase